MPEAQRTVCLKIDVDTLEGYLEGVPRLIDLFARRDVKATFCVATGPDRSGRAVRRIFTRKGFLKKMLRTGAVSMYGMRTMMYGTLLPAPMILRRAPKLIRDLLAAGHEVIPHGWDHIDWHDFLPRWDLKRTREHLTRACEELSIVTGAPCHAFAAPGWQATDRSLAVQTELGMEYSADTRGWIPFWPVVNGQRSTVLQMPTTLPTLDEVAGDPALTGAALQEHYLAMFARVPGSDFPGAPEDPARRHLHVYTGHTEVEGRSYADWFEGLITRLQAEGVEFATMRAAAQQLRQAGDTPVGGIHQGELPGRAGTVTCQV
jgi:peptidoglycan/xylan/chitin deacetylase (PgdA/CDA1 family)